MIINKVKDKIINVQVAIISKVFKIKCFKKWLIKPIKYGIKIRNHVSMLHK